MKPDELSLASDVIRNLRDKGLNVWATEEGVFISGRMNEDDLSEMDCVSSEAMREVLEAEAVEKSALIH